MAEITNPDAVIKKIQEFDSYMSQSIDVLKSLNRIEEDVRKQTQALSEKRLELAQFEKELSDLRAKASTIDQEADRLLNPIRKETRQLQELDNKLTDGLARLDSTIQNKMEHGMSVQAEARKAFEAHIKSVIDESRKEHDSKIADFLYKQNALVSNLSQQIDSYQRLTESLKSEIKRQKEQISLFETENSRLLNLIQSVRDLLQTQRQESEAALKKLQEGDIQQLKKSIEDLKSVLNEHTTKFGNMKFKKILGL